MEKYLADITEDTIYDDSIEMESFLHNLLASSRYEHNINTNINKKSQSFIELNLRSKLIKELKINIEKNNSKRLMPIIYDREIKKKYLLYLKAEHDYEMSIINTDLCKHIYDTKDDDISSVKNIFKVEKLSMSKLLKIEYLLTKEQYDETLKITQAELPSYELSKYASLIKDQIDEKQIFYYEIWDRIYSYMLNSEEEFKKWSKTECGNVENYNKKRYKYDLNTIIRDLFTDVKMVVKYLELSGDLNQYRDKLIEYFKYNQPNLTYVSINLENNTSQYYYPNKIINFKIDLNDSLQGLQNDLSSIYKEYDKHSKFNFLFKNKKIILDFSEKIEKKKNFQIMLFAFDAYLVGATVTSISTVLQAYGDPTATKEDKSVRSYIKYIHNILTKPTFPKPIMI